MPLAHEEGLGQIAPPAHLDAPTLRLGFHNRAWGTVWVER